MIRCMTYGNRDGIHLGHRKSAMQMWVDSHHPIDGAGEKLAIAVRRDRLARLKSFVLAHVSKIGRHQSDPRSAEIAGRMGGEQQPKRFVVRPVERTDEYYRARGNIRIEAHVSLTIGKSPRRKRADIASEMRG